ncbi:MAG: type II secretion system F family protein [Thermomicrobiales bacterium]
MTQMAPVLISLMAFAAVFGGIVVVGARPSEIGKRLARADGSIPPPMRMRSDKMVLPESESFRKQEKTGGKLAKMAAGSTKEHVRESTRKLLEQANSTMSVNTFLLLRSLLMFGIAPFMAIMSLVAYGLKPMGLGAAALCLLAIPRLPGMMMKRKAKNRAQAIERALPDALDLMVVCVEGGLSLDGAILQVATRTKGVVADEFRHLQRDMQTGMGRRDSFLAMAARSPSDSLSIVCSTITQADKMGMSVATTLRALTDTMRMRRRQEAEEKARKAPVKMMPFLIFFMIPALFNIILGPTVLQVMEMMK